MIGNNIPKTHMITKAPIPDNFDPLSSPPILTVSESIYPSMLLLTRQVHDEYLKHTIPWSTFIVCTLEAQYLAETRDQ